MNRGFYKFNRLLDRGFLRMIAYGYWAYTPKELQAGVHNFFENLSQPITIANDLLQYKIGYAFHDTSRFVINSTFGLAGFFDVAAYIGLEPRKEDFGQTLYSWGWKQSIYLVLPIWGPSTLRDTVGFVVDSLYFDPISYIRPEYIQPDNLSVYLGLGRMFDRRVQLLEAEKMLETVAVDEYTFVRNVYFQRRELVFHDGNLPQTEEEQDPFAEEGFDADTKKPEAKEGEAKEGEAKEGEAQTPHPSASSGPSPAER
jgi:phospholipid-binding lipoprotein MlaA